jgi:Zn-dependent peptidase ImmA (M78 family)/transcriptional regulator with XRE-family HTH domain
MSTEQVNIFASRLKLARKLAGLSLQELADLLANKVTKQALNKYELGQMNPTTDVLMSLAHTLGVKPDYFLQRAEVELGQIEFRKRAGLSKKNEESLIERAREYVERYLQAEQILGIPSAFRNPVSGITIISERDVEQAAAQLRSAWELGNAPIANIVEMLELKGIKVILIEDVDEIDGFFALTSQGVPIIVVNTQNRSLERIRFTLIHELAHMLLVLSVDIRSDKKRVEELCHYFASCFLMPVEVLLKMLGGPNRTYIAIKELINIKEYVGISIRAIVHRCRKAGIITDTYYQKWMVYMSKTYGAKEEPGHYKGEEKSNVLQQLVGRALSEGLISTSKAASLCNISVSELRKQMKSD